MHDADARRLFAGIGLIAVGIFGFVAPGAAQEIPEDQSCGGLVCDLGLFGHKTAPKPAAAVQIPAVVTPAPQHAAATLEPEPKRPAHKRARVAKATSAKTIAAKAIVAKAVAPAPVVPQPAAMAPAPFMPASMTPPAAAPFVPASIAPAAPIPVTAPPAPEAPVVLANPYVYTKPLNFMFQSVDPTQSAQ